MKKTLQLNDYAGDIRLSEPWTANPAPGRSREALIDALLLELGDTESKQLETESKRTVLRARLNVLPPGSLSKEAVRWLDGLLQIELNAKAITDVGQLSGLSGPEEGRTKLRLWQGDISTLQVDAIVNAANSQLLGCFQPLHNCIDNVIHSAAGIQLRDDCHVIMQGQGFEEPTGMAKITRAYNLPSRFVIHTVGPIVHGSVGKQHRTGLASAYRSCLDLCHELTEIRSIAFCGISTGVFGYPVEEAANLAIETVSKWLEAHPNSLDLVVFNVFRDADLQIYKDLMHKREGEDL